jgi:multiple RNA-binding domain-containing protein 1
MDQTAAAEDADSDEDYQSISASKRQQAEKPAPETEPVEHPEEPAPQPGDDEVEIKESEPSPTGEQEEVALPQNDVDWLRNRTNRLLGLLDEAEEERHFHNKPSDANSPLEENLEEAEKSPITDHAAVPPQAEIQAEPKSVVDAEEEAVRNSKRLFLRNLPYGVNEDDLREAFAIFGHLEEVNELSVLSLSSCMMIPDRDNLCFSS